MHNLILWNVIGAAAVAGIYGALAHVLVGRGGAGRTAFKAIGIILFLSRTAKRAVYPYVPQLTEEPRRELTRALLSS